MLNLASCIQYSFRLDLCLLAGTSILLKTSPQLSYSAVWRRKKLPRTTYIVWLSFTRVIPCFPHVLDSRQSYMDYVILDFCQGRVAQWLGLWTVEVLGAAVVEGFGSSPARSVPEKNTLITFYYLVICCQRSRLGVFGFYSLRISVWTFCQRSVETS